MRLARLNILKRNPRLLRPSLNHAADVFWAIVTTNHQRLTAPFDDLIERSDDSFRRQREIDFNTKGFSVEVIEHACYM